MPEFNDLNLDDWKESCKDIKTDSLWYIDKRDSSWKHSNNYHWNFIPQIPRQLIKRYTKKKWLVLDPFLWNWTTAIECENLNRHIIWIDIQEQLVKSIKNNITSDSIAKYFIAWDSAWDKIKKKLKNKFSTNGIDWVDLTILHPPYYNIINFSNKEKDLSNLSSIDQYLKRFSEVIENLKFLMKKGSYVGLVIGDIYTNKTRIPLGFKCMEVLRNKEFTLKSTIVKNIKWNRGKKGNEGLWRYRALSSDYYIFKHEYIFVLKKNK